MLQLDTRELAGGLSLVVCGAVFSAYAGTHYAIGTITRMGPGMVPVALGVILSILGLVVAAGAIGRARPEGGIRLVVPLIILASILVFALAIRPLGLLPAVVASVIVATFAERPWKPFGSLVLAVALALIAWGIFGFALQLPIAVVNWPS